MGKSVELTCALVYCSLGVIVGLCLGIAGVVMYKTVFPGTWGFIIAVLSLVGLLIHCLIGLEYLTKRLSVLAVIRMVLFIGNFAFMGGAAAIFYLIFSNMSTSTVLFTIGAIVTSSWGVSLMHYGSWYYAYLQHGMLPLSDGATPCRKEAAPSQQAGPKQAPAPGPTPGPT